MATTTPNHGLKKPQDTDNADLKVFVGENMDIIDTALASKASASHGHTIADVGGLQTALDGKLGTSSNAVSASKLATARTVTLSGDVTGSASFDGSANITVTTTVADDSHSHVISNVDGLQTALDGKLSTTGKASDSNLLDGLDSTVYYQRLSTQVVSGSDWNTFTEAGTYKVQGAVNTNTGAPPFTYAYGLLLVDRANNDSENRISQTYIPHSTSSDKNIYIRMFNSSAWTTWRVMPTSNDGRIVWHSENDGAGSGLDADLLDGYHASSFLQASANAVSASKLATARTITLAGDVTGSVSFDGSANVSITTAIADDSHNHTIANVDGLQTALDGKETPAGAQAKADQAETDAVNWAKSFGIGSPATTLGTSDLNALRNTGFYRGHREATGGVVNAPPRLSGDHSWFYLIHIEHDATWHTQIAMDFENNSIQRRVSKDVSGVKTWEAWRRIAHTDEVVSKGGDTMTGTLSLPAGTGVRSIQSSGSQYDSISLNSHNGHMWLRNQTGVLTFQQGTGGDDWTQSFSMHQPSAGVTANAQLFEIGQRQSNESNGRYKGVRIVKYSNGSKVDGDLYAGEVHATSVYNGGFDFFLGTGDQTSRGNTGSGRALVKSPNGQLTINYGADFYNGVVVDSPIGSDRFRGRSSHNKVYVGGESWGWIDTNTNAIRLQYDNSTYMKIGTGSVDFYFGGVVKHVLYSGGTKSGGSIEVDGRTLGMSPIDSPQVLLEYIDFDIPLTQDGTRVFLDTDYRKTVEHFAVFPNNGVIVEKGYDYFIIKGEGMADCRIVGERIGHTGVFYEALDLRNDERVETSETGTLAGTTDTQGSL